MTASLGATLAADLLAVLDAENAALRALDFPAATTLLARKRDVIAAIERGPAAAADPGLRAGVEAAAAENKRLLERAIAVQGEVLATIARAIRPALAGRSGYGASAVAPRGSAPALTFRARA